MKRIFQIVIFSIITISTHAQDSVLIQRKKHQIGISTGFSKHIIQDHVISPLVYKGIKAPIWIKYKYYGDKFNHRFQAYFNQPELESYITNRKSNYPHYTENANLYLSYSVNRKILSINKYKTGIFIGGQFKSYLNYRDHYYKKNVQATTAEQNTSLDFKLLLNKRYNSNNDLISFNLSFPIISYALESGMYNSKVNTNYYDIDPDKNKALQYYKNGNFVFLNRLFDLQSELSIYKSLNNTIAFGLCYFFHFYSFEKHPDLNRTKYTNSQLLLEILIKL